MTGLCINLKHCKSCKTYACVFCSIFTISFTEGKTGSTICSFQSPIFNHFNNNNNRYTGKSIRMTNMIYILPTCIYTNTPHMWIAGPPWTQNSTNLNQCKHRFVLRYPNAMFEHQSQYRLNEVITLKNANALFLL